MNLDNELYISTQKVMSLLGVNSRRVSAIAKRLGWKSREVYSGRGFPGKEYLAVHVEAELNHRLEKERMTRPKTILIKCACGESFPLPDPGKATCPGCGMEYRATAEGIFWEKANAPGA